MYGWKVTVARPRIDGVGPNFAVFGRRTLYSSVEGAGDCREAASNDGCWVVEPTVVGL